MSKVIWLTGISGAGKTTLGARTVEYLQSQGYPVEYLDGDQVRAFFEGDLGYTRAERIQNVRRVCFAAHLLAAHGIYVVVANIAPYYEVRDFIRRKLGERYIQIYVKASLEAVMERDVQGHYAKVQNGSLTHMVGVDDVYDPPRNPDLTVNTEDESVEHSFKKITAYLLSRGIPTTGE